MNTRDQPAIIFDFRMYQMFKMLVVDDNVEFRQSLAHTLTNHFPTNCVFTADSVEEVMRQLVSNTPNLIFMSIRFSHGIGLELCKYLKPKYPDIDFIITSSFNKPEYRNAVMNLGAQYLITKDLPPEEILRFIRKILDIEVL